MALLYSLATPPPAPWVAESHVTLFTNDLRKSSAAAFSGKAASDY